MVKEGWTEDVVKRGGSGGSGGGGRERWRGVVGREWWREEGVAEGR